MKIGILTQPLRHNYGGLLQNYALQQVLISMGHSVETFNWEWKDPMPRAIKARIKWMIKRMLGKKKVLPDVGDIVSFRNKYLFKTRPISSRSAFKHAFINSSYDVLITGSDQCWRPCYNYYLYEMFQCFAKENEIIKRVAYGASFGTDICEYTHRQKRICRELVQKFDAVSVREQTGIELCKKMFGIRAKHVLDPTFLLSKEDYTTLIEKEQTPHSPGELFYYVLDNSQKFAEIISNISTKTNLLPFQVLRTTRIPKNSVGYYVQPSVTAWLRAFMDAKMVIVDSFHGMVFSIIFNKPFWVIGNKERGMARFDSLLGMFGLRSRLQDIESIRNVSINQEIDWEYVNEKLDGLRKDSLSFIEKSLE